MNYRKQIKNSFYLIGFKEINLIGIPKLRNQLCH
jgi:hypothetical protein